MKDKFEDATDLDGFEDLKPEDQAKVVQALQEGHVAEEDIPESAKKAEGDDGEDKPKRKKAPPKKKDDGDDKPKRVRKPKVSLPSDS